MANLASTDVTVLDSWTVGGTSSKRNKVRRVKWTNTTAGGATNLLTASGFGFSKILSVSNVLLNASTKKIYQAAVAADGSAIYISDASVATDGDRAKVIDLATSTDYAYATIEGVFP